MEGHEGQEASRDKGHLEKPLNFDPFGQREIDPLWAK